MSDIILAILLQFIHFLSMMRKGETMKKQIWWLMMISLFLALFFYNKWYYSTLPEQLSVVSKREVLNRIQHSEEPLVKIDENEDYEFYISLIN
jgi:hypothetical protein